MPLHRTPDGFALDLRALSACRIGSSARDSFDLRLTPSREGSSETTGEFTCLEESKGAFVDGLRQIWGRSATALLAPNPRHLPPIAGSKQEELCPGGSNSGDPMDPKEQASVQLETTLVKLFTSGSSGEPKCHEKSARQLFGEAQALVKLLQLGPVDTILSTTAFHHIYGLLFGVLAPWAAGSQIVTDAHNEANAFHPERIASLACRLKVTLLVTVPAHLRALTAARPDLGTVKRVICSAAPLASADARSFEHAFGIEVLDILGSTETGGIATRRPAHSSDWTPLPGITLATEEDHHLLLRSPFTGEPDSFTKTGDRARLHGDGSFEYLGRSDGVAKVGGKRLHLAEIEKLARELPGVSDALALSRPVSSFRGQELLLVVQGCELSSDWVKRALRNVLDATFVPRRVRVVEHMPRDERGKTSRQVAMALFDTWAKKPTLVRLRIAKDSRRFEGHFPGEAIYPAVAQLIDLILPEVRRAFGGEALSELKGVKWHKPIKPGDELTLALCKKANDSNWVHFELNRAEERVCSGVLSLGE